jgi:hypothetical protein
MTPAQERALIKKAKEEELKVNFGDVLKAEIRKQKLFEINFI